MNEKIFHRAMSYVDDDIVENFLENKSKREMKVLPLRKSRIFLKWGAVAAVFCLVCATSVVMLLNFPNNSTTPTVPATSSSTVASSDTATPNSTEPTFTLPVPIDEIIWYENKGGASSDSAWMEWNGMKLSYDLENAIYRIEKGYESKQYLAIQIRYGEGEQLDRYVYEGKGYAEHQEELKAWNQLKSKYYSLANEADKLKYGELLYTEGLPDGTKWTKEHYDERVAYYGEEFLSEFIVDGVYLVQKLGLAFRENEARIEKKEKMFIDLIQSFHKDSPPEIAEAFSQYAVTVKNDIVFLFITLSDFKTINIENKEDYVFALATRAAYDGYIETPDVPVFDDSVTGFAYEKIKFASFSGNWVSPIDEIDVIFLLNEMMDEWKWNGDYFDFCFEYDGKLTEDDFSNMQYFKIYQDNYLGDLPEMVVRVKFKDINLEAFKELSNREEITRIIIYGPLIAVPD
ncbi:MAG: hypothetical protein IKM34_03025 [Clostridia bacterium]|nr:hypothetical protein [Clostridia bacterium]